MIPRRTIIQLAKDYDLSEWLVQDIVEKYPNSYYSKLEETIKERE